MTVQELITELSHCNPSLPVFFAVDCCTAVLVKSAEFRTFDGAADAESVEFGFAGEHHGVMLFERHSDIAEYIAQTGGMD